MMATPTVYFVQAATLGLIKIGVTVDIDDRLKTLQVGSPDRLVIIGAIFDVDAHSIEEDLHARFAADRSHGEWFRPSAGLLEVIAQHSMDAYDAARADEVLGAMSAAYG